MDVLSNLIVGIISQYVSNHCCTVYTLKLHTVTCQLYLNKTGKIKVLSYACCTLIFPVNSLFLLKTLFE